MYGVKCDRVDHADFSPLVMETPWVDVRMGAMHEDRQITRN